MNYTVIKTKRRTICLEITRDCEIIVRAPLQAKKDEIDKFVNSHFDWVTKKLTIQQKRQLLNNEIDDNSDELKRLAAEYIPERVRLYSNLMKLYPSSVKITSAKTRFGSCSGKNAICFSWRLMQYDKSAVDYVVVHELAHIKFHNHSKQFYKEIEKYMPDYRQRQKILRM